MSKIMLTGFALVSVLLFANASGNKAIQSKETAPEPLTGTLQKMIVENASVTMQLDLNELNLLRGLQPGSMPLALQNFSSAGLIPLRQGYGGQDAPGYSNLPVGLRSSIKQLAVEKLRSKQGFDLAVRDSKTGFTFFNVEGGQYDYNANAQSLSIAGSRLLISKQFANALSRPSDAGSIVGNISVGAAMQPIGITQLVKGKAKSVVVPPLSRRSGPGAPTLVPGPDIIVGDLPDLEQFGSAGSEVGLAVATTSCNNGDQPVNFLALPNTDHPLVPQNLYRMSGGADNTQRLEQIGQSWMKHTFGASEFDECDLGCNTNNCSQFFQLCPGCSDPYNAEQNGTYDLIGSRAWVNPFTGSFPSSANNHTGHVHNGVSHRIRVNVDDLNTTLNTGATYFVEVQYLTPLEFEWCQSHPGECNMYNNASYRQFLVSGTTTFTFSPLAPTVRMQPAIMAWTGATVNQVEPDPGNDGIWFMGYKVTNPSAGVWHYEYALYNQNLDRGIQSFSVPLGAGANLSNIGFHAPPQEPGWANDGTFNNLGYSSTPWAVTQGSNSITWNTEMFAQNQNANAIRWGTLYNFYFDADQPPETANAIIGFFKTGSPMMVAIQAPVGNGTPTPTPTATATPRPTPSPRTSPLPRPRPTPPPRP